MASTFVSESSLKSPETNVNGHLVDLDGERFYCVTNFDAMAPFLMSLVSASDHWLFISSNGALTAGRKDPDHAIFPYYTDDRIHDSQHQTGSKSLLRVTREGKTSLWEPFSQRYQGLYGLTRNLYKSVYGNKILFEEINQELSLTFRYEWMSSERFGFVRRTTIINDGEAGVAIDLLDGIQNVLPYGLDRRFQMEYSTLADGYKRTELLADSGLALFCLSSIPVDKAEPSEALRVNLAWSTGLDEAKHLLSSSQFEAFRRGFALQQEKDVRGQRGAYMLNATLLLQPCEARDWLIVAEVNQDAAGIRALVRCLNTSPTPSSLVLEDVARGTKNLIRTVANADGLERTGDELSSWRHFSNTLFNVMRGGVPDDNYRLSRADLKSFLVKSNTGIAEKYASFLDSLPETLTRTEFIGCACSINDLDLHRLANEYLPLTFSRRHGDPSRPWNIFSIEVKNDHGQKVLNYQGNWRDIFQNWEALGHSFPGFLTSMIFKFIDCSTADGYNPYRVLREGFEWETVDPHDAWSFIGYWGDHQVIYLLKLLEASERFYPGNLVGLLGQRVFTYANIPYRIRPYQELLANPRNTIFFDQKAHKLAMDRSASLGADGKTLLGLDGPSRANLTEKLLLVALSKLSNFIPEGGIWMNTQRPEWNDANNALVGYGISMVTLYSLRRYLAFCRGLFDTAESRSFDVSTEIAEFLGEITGVLEKNASSLSGRFSIQERKHVLDGLGTAGTNYREQIYQHGFSEDRLFIPAKQLRVFCDLALHYLDHSIRVNRRNDGLYHSYNLMKATDDGIEVRNLYLMLEGQVAVLSSGALSVEESLVLLDALRASDLYRADQASYMLYPDRPLPRFLEKNNIPPSLVVGSTLLQALLKAGDDRIVTQDVDGLVHFNADFRNAENLRAALDSLQNTEFQSKADAERDHLLSIYELVFDHQSFTGRSGTFFKYEGLGCIYWHMVSKLLLAVDEVRKGTPKADIEALSRLNKHYQEIREGIGVHKTPAVYGAIPTDPYSHTPGFAGAQQPGMTGQVKEDLLTRLSEMGLHVADGCITFKPWLVPPTEFLQEGASFSFMGKEGQTKDIPLEKGSFAFTFCQVPVVAYRKGHPSIGITLQDGSVESINGLSLDATASEAIFQRTEKITRLDVFLGLGD